MFALRRITNGAIILLPFALLQAKPATKHILTLVSKVLATQFAQSMATAIQQDAMRPFIKPAPPSVVQRTVLAAV